MKPCCPYCPQIFDTWAFAKRHVKFCILGPNPRSALPLSKWQRQQNERLDCIYCGEYENDFALLAAHTIVEHNPQGYSETSKEMQNAMKLGQEVLTAHPQLMPGMLANLGNSATIVNVREAGKAYQYSDFVLDVQIDKTTYEIPCKSINEDFRYLAVKLGLDTDKWAGKKLKLSTDEYTSTRTGKKSDIIRFDLA